MIGYSVDIMLNSYIWNTDYFNLIFQSLEVVSRYRDTQLQVTENVCGFVKFRSQNISMFQDWRQILLLATGYNM